MQRETRVLTQENEHLREELLRVQVMLMQVPAQDTSAAMIPRER